MSNDFLTQPDIVIKTNKGLRNAKFLSGHGDPHTVQTTKAVTAAMVAKRAVSISTTSAGSIAKKRIIANQQDTTDKKKVIRLRSSHSSI